MPGGVNTKTMPVLPRGPPPLPAEAALPFISLGRPSRTVALAMAKQHPSTSSVIAKPASSMAAGAGSRAPRLEDDGGGEHDDGHINKAASPVPHFSDNPALAISYRVLYADKRADAHLATRPDVLAASAASAAAATAASPVERAPSKLGDSVIITPRSSAANTSTGYSKALLGSSRTVLLSSSKKLGEGRPFVQPSAIDPLAQTEQRRPGTSTRPPELLPTTIESPRKNKIIPSGGRPPHVERLALMASNQPSTSPRSQRPMDSLRKGNELQRSAFAMDSLSEKSLAPPTRGHHRPCM